MENNKYTMLSCKNSHGFLWWIKKASSRLLIHLQNPFIGGKYTRGMQHLQLYITGVMIKTISTQRRQS